MDLYVGSVTGFWLGEKRDRVGYEYGKVGYPSLIPDLPKSKTIHKITYYLISPTYNLPCSYSYLPTYV